MSDMTEMFCFQCQEAARGKACTVRGVCGKTPEVAALQDLLIWLLKGISFWAVRARRHFSIKDTETDLFVAQALFSTITNVNFDPDRFVSQIQEAIARRDALRAQVQRVCQTRQDSGMCSEELPEHAIWAPQAYEVGALQLKGRTVGVMAISDLDPDVRSLRELVVYGLKGMAAYIDHACVLGEMNEAILAFIEEALDATADQSLDAEDLVHLVLRTGEMGIDAMRLLDTANTTRYGDPEPTQVDLSVRPGPGILVSGHDLRDLEELLEQTQGTGVNVYTHGEMLPANAYPFFKRYKHFVGNYGGSWWHQHEEFEAFGGAILMTTNCLIPPKESYKHRLFTTGHVGWPGVQHIPDREPGEAKDFTPVIKAALRAAEPKSLEQGSIPIGFAHGTVMGAVDHIIEAVQKGEIKRFVVMAGCDGRHRSRAYYTELAQALPQDHVILTAGCAKYRYNKLNLGTVAGLPRVLDAGQCNDSYSLAYIALKLKEALGLDDINELPISYDIAWYEQKAIIVLLALLALGVKHIRLGPTLPAFLSPGVKDVLVKHFDIRPIGSVEEDLTSILQGL